MNLTALAARQPLRSAERLPNGTAIGVGFAVTANLACLVGAARFVTPVFVAGAVVAAALLARARPLVALELAVWLWLLGPQVRRAVDLATGYHEPSVILAAAPLASLAALPHLRRLRHWPTRRAVKPMMVVLAAVAAAYAVGALRIGLQPASVALLTWAVPMLFGMQVVAATDDVAQLRATVERILVWGALIVGAYGIVQFYAVPAWDAFWMRNVPMNTIGSPEPLQVRVFSTLNAPGPLAVVLAVAALFLTEAGHRLRIPAQIAAYVALALSLVRAAWLACLIGLVVVLVAGRPRAKTTALVSLAVVTVGVLQVSGPVQQIISDRVEETREGRQDDSFAARMDLHSQMVPHLLDDTLGRGLGATGGAGQFATGSSVRLIHLDSGFIDFAYSLGVPLAMLAFGAMILGGMDLARTGVRAGTASAATVASGLSVLVQMAFGNSLSGVGGVVFYLLWALAIRETVAANQSAPWGSRA